MQIIITTKLPVAYTQSLKGNSCVKKTIIPHEVYMFQAFRANNDRPYWVKNPKVWKTMNPEDKIRAFVETFNEGLGVSYEYVQ